MSCINDESGKGKIDSALEDLAPAEQVSNIVGV